LVGEDFVAILLTIFYVGYFGINKKYFKFLLGFGVMDGE